MDDLAGLSWDSSASQKKQQPSAPHGANYYPTLRPTPPVSGRSTPANASQPSAPTRPGATGASKSSTPANDSFASLLPFNSGQSAKNLSLQEQQRALEAQKAQKLGFASPQPVRGLSASPQPPSNLSSGRSTPSHAFSPPLQGLGYQGSGSKQSTGFNSLGQQPSGGRLGVRGVGTAEKEEDILAAFNANAPVDRSTHFPAPNRSEQVSVSPNPAAGGFSKPNGDDFSALDDDDPFGLGGGPSKPPTSSRARERETATDDDDVLGLLGKPVSELPPRRQEPPAPARSAQSAEDKALAELVDMGFPPERAQEALENTESGTDVQAAVGWLLNQAHSQSRKKAEPSSSRERDGRTSAPRRDNSRSPMPPEDRDPSKAAAEFGSNFLKSANSFWKSSQKKLNKAVADFNADTDSSQPKWMRDGQSPAGEERPRREKAPQTAAAPVPRQARQTHQAPPGDAGLVDMTDEAMMLEGGGGPPKPKQRQQRPQAEPTPHSPLGSRTQSPASTQSRPPPQAPRPNRRFVEEETPQAYVSPARRKKATPQPAAASEPDLLFGGSQTNGAAHAQASRPSSAAPSRPQAKAKSAPLPSRPRAPPRNIPAMSSIALKASTQHRVKGNAAFKLGNYGEATEAYSASLRDIPDKHPLAILLLTNRALTNLKTGDPKASIADADAAIEVIGPARGLDEEIDVGGDEGKKAMAPFWGKAMMRRAEALEQLERWADAGRVWAECVQAGVGGSQSIQGRTRCEKAAAPKPAAPPRRPTPAKKPAPKPAPRASALDDLEGRQAAAPAAASGEAVNRLRAANAAADKADDERFALADSVDARLTAWRKGKETNLRALLGSLDTVLWADSGWKKVGMGELLQPNKVKVAYMKGIAKVHPDKLPTTATTEQVMISGAVFATLNEAWDKFKSENGL